MCIYMIHAVYMYTYMIIYLFLSNAYHNDKCHDGFVSYGIPVDVHVRIYENPPIVTLLPL